MLTLLSCAGGKTASLKALGLTAIMAKAGLFIPTAHHPTQHTPTPPPHQYSLSQQPQQQQVQQDTNHQQQEAQQQQQQQQQPRLVFFDKVLADVGDSQNLQQSLSTFSGHIRRVGSILAEATPDSLVLLDEVGRPHQHNYTLTSVMQTSGCVLYCFVLVLACTLLVARCLSSAFALDCYSCFVFSP